MWIPGKVVSRIDGIIPLVAQWEKSTNPAQIRLLRYLEETTGKFLPLPPVPTPLYLHLHICAKSEAALLRQCDVENYLTPLFGRRWLDPRRFELVIGTKDASSASSLTVGIAQPVVELNDKEGWTRCCVAPHGSPSVKNWKEQLRNALIQHGCTLPVDGAVDCRASIRCSSGRNWTALWKPIGDTMGPVLGYTNAANPFHPRDDRITRLEFRRIVDDRLRWNVEVEYAWRMAKV